MSIVDTFSQFLEPSSSNTNASYQPPQLCFMMGGRSLNHSSPTPLLAVDSLRYIKSHVRYFMFLRLCVASLQNKLLIKPKSQKLSLGNAEWLQRVVTYGHVLCPYQCSPKKCYSRKMDTALKREPELIPICALVSFWTV